MDSESIICLRNNISIINISLRGYTNEKTLSGDF